jgi:branched-chain amino acid transport system ATP-binding protein
MLEVEALETAYGESQVLFGMELALGAREVVALMGRNGMGKTTTIRSIMGLVRPFAGSVRFEGQEVLGLRPHLVAQRGIGLVPEGRQIFPNLTVFENLVATAVKRRGRNAPAWTLERVLALFPRLTERRQTLGGRLSGGEQQMLAIGRALMTNPKLLILDEATEGLAPLVRREIWACIAGLKAEGQSILVVDKHIDHLLELADRLFIVEKGRCAWRGTPTAFRAETGLKERFLGV